MEMIKNGEDTVEALTTSSEWFGMTYPEDLQEAKEKIKKILS